MEQMTAQNWHCLGVTLQENTDNLQTWQMDERSAELEQLACTQSEPRTVAADSLVLN